MKPIYFEQSNRTLTRPSSMTAEECTSLHVWTDGSNCVSCWEPSWRERLAVVFGRPLWLWVRSGKNQPPVAVSLEHPWPEEAVGGE